MPMALRYTTPPPERESGTRPRALGASGTPCRAGRTACGVIQGGNEGPVRCAGRPERRTDGPVRRMRCRVGAKNAGHWNAVPTRGDVAESHRNAVPMPEYVARSHRNTVPTSRYAPTQDERPEAGARFSFLRRHGVLAEQRARFTPGSSGSVRHPLPGCRMNEKRVPDSGRGRTAGLGCATTLRRDSRVETRPRYIRR